MTIVDQIQGNDQNKYNRLKVAVLTSGPSGTAAGGAERFFQGLLQGLRSIGCQVELIFIPADEPTYQAIADNFARAAALDLSGFDVVISTKAPTYAIHHPAHVMYLVHTTRVFDDMFRENFPKPNFENFRQRATLHGLEFKSILNAHARFAIGKEVSTRFYRWRGFSAEVIHPPLLSNPFRQGPTGDYFFLPGRLHRWKRVDLVIKAILQSALPLKLKIAGTGVDEAELRALANRDPRIEFLGPINDQKLVELYAGALAVPFMPIQEDYGYITLEAFASGKPVITCTDSGEPAFFVRHGVNGFLCQPDPESVKEAMEALYLDRNLAIAMGRRGLDLIAQMPTWPEVATRLVEAALAPKKSYQPDGSNVCVIDMQPIDPPVGGGRLRLLGLYHNLGANTRCTYVGTYDWPDEPYRSHMLSPTLKEIDIPLSSAHHTTADNQARLAGGKVVIDLTFSQLAHLSPEYLRGAIQHASEADVVIISHPWVFGVVRDHLRPDQVVIYDSHNVEGYLRAQLLDENNPFETDILHQVVEIENELGWRADWILTCSHEDLLKFHRLYGFPCEKMRVVPNGVMAFQNPAQSDEIKQSARAQLNIAESSLLAVFIGSNYKPNLEAAEFIIQQIAPANKNVTFVIAGGVGNRLKSNAENVIITGSLTETEKQNWFYASDFAINPMTSGSGTNIKMFDFMAAGLPVISTAVGARGIDTVGRNAILLAEPTAQGFLEALNKLQDAHLRAHMGHEARQCVEERYAWERISAQLGAFIDARRRAGGQSRPLFSVIIPTCNNQDNLTEMLERLRQQLERDFEVVLVDQSVQPWQGANREYGFALTYFHSPTRGTAQARNIGAMLAQGSILAFTEDTCHPAEDWLFWARTYFSDSTVVSLEGRVLSDPGLAPDGLLTPNADLIGLTFQPANLFVRSSIFQQIGGFPSLRNQDLRYQQLYFGQMLGRHGNTAFAPEVQVLHRDLPQTMPLRTAPFSLPGSWSEPAGVEENIRALVADSKKVAHFTTTGLKCGIGQYTSRIIHEYHQHGIQNLILNCDAADQSVSEMPAGIPSQKVWYYDNEHLGKSNIYPKAFETLKNWGADTLVIQYHPAFFSTEQLLQLVLGSMDISHRILVICHKYSVYCIDVFTKLNWLGIPILSHRQSEIDRAASEGVIMGLIPLGIEVFSPLMARSISFRDWEKHPPLIVTNGFLRSHKGLKHLIQAMPAILKEFPGARLLIQCPLYPSPDSPEELNHIIELANRLQVSNNVLLNTQYLDKDIVLNEIAKGDLAVFPYEPSNEGGSGSATDALSVGLPIVISTAEIFDGVRDLAITTAADGPSVARAVIELLQSPEVYNRLATSVVAYASENSWEITAWKMLAYLGKPE